MLADKFGCGLVSLGSLHDARKQTGFGLQHNVADTALVCVGAASGQGIIGESGDSRQQTGSSGGMRHGTFPPVGWGGLRTANHIYQSYAVLSTHVYPDTGEG